MTVVPRTIDDLPHFHVSAIKQSETRKADFELSSGFDRTADVSEGRCSLLLPGKDVLIALNGDFRFLDSTAGTGLFQTSEESMPEVVGLELAYLGAKWEPYHVWMVAEPRWKWSKTLFHAADAISRVVKENGISVVEGEEIKEWIEVRRKEKASGLSRFYPVFPSGKTKLPAIEADGLIKGGWDHAHCELCNGHVDAEKYGYVDLGEHWVCEACYTKYVVSHDLSFL
jgi:hypothetical protein